jgi:hypothetical protein
MLSRYTEFLKSHVEEYAFDMPEGASLFVPSFSFALAEGLLYMVFSRLEEALIKFCEASQKTFETPPYYDPYEGRHIKENLLHT